MYDLSRYHVSLEHGFLPLNPLTCLPTPHYDEWEAILADLPRLIRTRQIGAAIERLPVLSLEYLVTENDWRRAHTALAFLAHSWVWGSGVLPNEIVPPCISIPFLQTSAHLGVPPTVSYAVTSIWNFNAAQGADWSDPEQLTTPYLFTGTYDETWFYVISAAIENLGAACIRIILSAMEACLAEDIDTATTQMQQLPGHLLQIGEMLDRMYEKCRPEVFYHQMRPFWAGAKGMEAALPNGIFYDTTPEGSSERTEEKRVVAGASAAQSPLFHFLDAALAVQRRTGGKADTATTLMEMRELMPAPHREFIEQVREDSTIRECSQRHGGALLAAYNESLANLTDFRDRHIRIAARYIVNESKQPSNTVSADAIKLSSANANLEPSYGLAEEAKGTGGTPFMSFLKQSRNETRSAVI